MRAPRGLENPPRRLSASGSAAATTAARSEAGGAVWAGVRHPRQQHPRRHPANRVATAGTRSSADLAGWAAGSAAVSVRPGHSAVWAAVCRVWAAAARWCPGVSLVDLGCSVRPLRTRTRRGVRLQRPVPQATHPTPTLNTRNTLSSSSSSSSRTAPTRHLSSRRLSRASCSRGSSDER